MDPLLTCHICSRQQSSRSVEFLEFLPYLIICAGLVLPQPPPATISDFHPLVRGGRGGKTVRAIQDRDTGTGWEKVYPWLILPTSNALQIPRAFSILHHLRPIF